MTKKGIRHLGRMYGFSIGEDDIIQEIHIKLILDDRAGYKACKNHAISLCRREKTRTAMFESGEEVDVAVEFSDAERTMCIKQFIGSLSLVELTVVKKLAEGSEKQEIAKFVLKSPATISGIIKSLKVKLLEYL